MTPFRIRNLTHIARNWPLKVSPKDEGWVTLSISRSVFHIIMGNHLFGEIRPLRRPTPNSFQKLPSNAVVLADPKVVRVWIVCRRWGIDCYDDHEDNVPYHLPISAPWLPMTTTMERRWNWQELSFASLYKRTIGPHRHCQECLRPIVRDSYYAAKMIDVQSLLLVPG
jgi:hypothetical protein